MSEEMCENCNRDFAATGLTQCAICIVREKLKVDIENDKLQARIKELEEKLSLYEWNYNLEDAPRDGSDILICDQHGFFRLVFWEENTSYGCPGWWTGGYDGEHDELYEPKCFKIITPPTQEGDKE